MTAAAVRRPGFGALKLRPLVEAASRWGGRPARPGFGALALWPLADAASRWASRPRRPAFGVLALQPLTESEAPAPVTPAVAPPVPPVPLSPAPTAARPAPPVTPGAPFFRPPASGVSGRLGRLGRGLKVQLALAVPLLVVAALWSTSSRDDRYVDDAPRPGAPVSAAPAPPAAAQAPSLVAPSAADVPAVPVATAAADAPARPRLTPYQEPRPSEPGFDVQTLARAVGSIGVVVLLILGCAGVLKRLTGGATSPASGGVVRVLETTHIPAPGGRSRAAVYLMSVGERRLLVGATDAQLTLLAELDDEPQPAPTTPFPTLLAAATHSPAAGGVAPDPDADTLSHSSVPHAPDGAALLARLGELERRYRTRPSRAAWPAPAEVA